MNIRKVINRLIIESEIEDIQKDCSDWLDKNYPIFYRGINHRGDESKVIDISKFPGMINRKPKDTNPMLDKLTEFIREATNDECISRRDATFAMMEKFTGYGTSYIFVPCNGYNFFTCTTVNDYFTATNIQFYDLDDDEKLLLNKYMDKKDYKTMVEQLEVYEAKSALKLVHDIKEYWDNMIGDTIIINFESPTSDNDVPNKRKEYLFYCPNGYEANRLSRKPFPHCP